MNVDELRTALDSLLDDHSTPSEKAERRRDLLPRLVESEAAVAAFLQKEQDVDLRIELLNLIGDTREARFVPAVKHVLDTDVREAVLQAAATDLGKLAGPESYPLLTDLLSHASPDVRLGAIQGLTILGDERAVEHLRVLLNDDRPVRQWHAGPSAGGNTLSQQASSAIRSLEENRT